MSLLRNIAKQIAQCINENKEDNLVGLIQNVLQNELIGENVVVMTKDEHWIIHTTVHCVDCDGEAEFKQKETGLDLCGGCVISRHERGASNE